MPYLIALAVIGALFIGFLLLTKYEARRGTRFFAAARYRLDAKVGRALFVMEHIDWGAFTAHLTRTTATTVAHDVAHGSLIAVRAAERFLTRAVRVLRIRRDDAAALPPPAIAPAIEPEAEESRAALPEPEPEPEIEQEAKREAEPEPEPAHKLEHTPMPEPEPALEPEFEAPSPARTVPPRGRAFDIRPPSRRR